MASKTEFHLNSDERDGAVRLAPCGELDLYTTDAFDAVLRRYEEVRPQLLVLDLRELKFIDSTGLRSLLSAARRARERNGRVAIVRGPEEVQQVFRICGIERFFEVVDQPGDLYAG